VATYPAIPIEYGASEAMETDRQMERASNGTARGRVFFTSAKRRFSISHKHVKAADLATYKAFHAANIAVAFDFVYPADTVTYSCLFAKDPVYTPSIPGRTTISVELIEA
jgi:hypothetical protein